MLKIYADGVEIRLEIKEFYHTDIKWWDEWCSLSYSFTSQEWLNYVEKNVHILLCSELIYLKEKIEKLLNDEIEEIEEVDFAEPDYSFVLYPVREKDSYGDNDHNEQLRFKMDWRLHFWDHGSAVANYFSVSLYKNEIIALYEYLKSFVDHRVTMGEILTDDLKCREISPSELASKIKVPVTEIEDVMNDKTRINISLGRKIQKCLELPRNYYRNLQRQIDKKYGK